MKKDGGGEASVSRTGKKERKWPRAAWEYTAVRNVSNWNDLHIFNLFYYKKEHNKMREMVVTTLVDAKIEARIIEAVAISSEQ